ncbi:hypothetical protein LCGC14_3005000 [marine sediment metagenome]|uniref:Uncharacterized protein n=1 Tax=marine sediment metagenome TaxID=412755 RepID=A0A0F8WZW5_9ZZZZ
MIGRITGAVLRGLLVALLIATPSLILPRVDPDGAQVIALVAIFAALLTAFEYGSNYPCLFEFRDAPPFNRIRFLSLMMTVVLLSLIARGQYEPNSLSSFLALAGHLVAGSLDFPYSPVRLVILMLPEGTDDASLFMVRTSAGLVLTGTSGKIRIHTRPARLRWRVIARRTASI